MSQEILPDLVSVAGKLAAGTPPLRRVRLSRGTTHLEIVLQAAESRGSSAVAAPAADDSARRAEDDDPQVEVPAPLAGTFYIAAEPGAAPFVRVDDEVDGDTQIGIIEAMKLMSPINAGIRGVITAVLVADGETVQFGQPILRLRTE
jgi:biotin carboxyl carrier protein